MEGLLKKIIIIGAATVAALGSLLEMHNLGNCCISKHFGISLLRLEIWNHYAVSLKLM